MTTSFLRLHGPISLATQDHECWSCHQPTPVHSIVAADVEDIAEGDEPDVLEASSFVHDLSPESLPAAVQDALARIAPNYKPTYSRTMRETT